ncbi:TPA: hypothetical protein SMV68_005077 [Pseudomonas aeruginosa]|nr:hypothetical protein [Pseudomonas aeruginosa]
MNDINIERKITLMKRDRNYGSDDIEGLISSLKHSLRLEQNEYDDFERDEKLSHLNRITINGETEELKEDKSVKILEKIINEFKNDVNETKNTSLNEKERNLYRQNRKKLRDYSSSIDIEEISKYIDETMNGLNQFNQNDYAQILSRNNQKRINQKVELLQSYIELDLKLKGNEKVKTHANRIKEVVIVIPEKNKIGDPIGYCDFLRTTAIDFYNEFFPDFDIKFAVSHADETSPHAHLFIDLKNKKTNKYDFNTKEKEFIDNFIKNNPEIKFDKKPEPDSYKLKRRSLKKQQYLYQRDLKKWHGEILQTAFYKFFNYSAKINNKPVYAEKLEKTKEYKERNKLIEEEAKKPKSERSHNYYQKKINDQKELINKLNNKINIKENENKALQEKNNELELKFEKMDNNYKNGLNKTSELHKEFKEKQEQIKKLEESKKLKINEFDKTINSKKEEIQKLENKIIDNNKVIKQKKEEFNKEIDRVYEIIQKDSNELIEKVNKKLSLFESTYAKLSSEISEFKNSINKSMAEEFKIFGKLKDIKMEFNKINGDKKNGVFNGLVSYIMFGSEKDNEQVNKLYQEATKSFDEDFGIGSLLIVDEIVKTNKTVEEIKEIKPVFDKTVKPAIDKKLDDLEFLQSKTRTYKTEINDYANELKQEIEIDKKKFKMKI